MRRHPHISLVVAGLLCSGRCMATDYLFHVGCQSDSWVVQWSTGTIDPGREYLRVVTGTRNPGCTISDYNAAVDRSLRREHLSHEGGVISGVPFLGSLICGLLHCPN